MCYRGSVTLDLRPRLSRKKGFSLSPSVWKPKLLHTLFPQEQLSPQGWRARKLSLTLLPQEQLSPARLTLSNNEEGCDYSQITRKHSLSLKNNKTYNKDRQTLEALKCESEKWDGISKTKLRKHFSFACKLAVKTLRKLSEILHKNAHKMLINRQAKETSR